MTREEARQTLHDGGEVIIQESRLPNNTGWQLRTDRGGVVNIYDSGKFNIQGRDAERLGLLFFDGAASGWSDEEDDPERHGVLVAFGDDLAARSKLLDLLRGRDVAYRDLDQFFVKGETVFETIDRAEAMFEGAIVLVTPDDRVHLSGHPNRTTRGVNQSTLLILGMLLTAFGPDRVLILVKDPEEMELPSEILDLNYTPFNDDLREIGAVNGRRSQQKSQTLSSLETGQPSRSLEPKKATALERPRSRLIG